MFLAFVFFLPFLGCKEETLPKPKAMLRLEYPDASTTSLETDMFSFDHNGNARLKSTNNNAFTLDYPQMKGSLFITYKSVDNNLNKLLADAQKLSYEHVTKADNIAEQPFINEKNSVYGMYYEIFGDAASQSQFYVTDSVKHFVTGSLYFYAKPNFDSIQPAAAYLQKDIRRIMETLRWKN